jgi:hypothetical protein
MTHALSRRSWCTALAAATLLLPGCGDDDTTIAGTYVARLGDTFVALSLDDPDGLAVAYACDGREGAPTTVYAWFEGTLSGGAGELTGKWGSLTIDAAAGHATGELRLTGAEPQAYAADHSAAAALVWGSSPPAEADLLGGWIFADDGIQRGAVLKRPTSDVAAFTLPSITTASIVFMGTKLSVERMLSPEHVQ